MGGMRRPQQGSGCLLIPLIVGALTALVIVWTRIGVMIMAAPYPLPEDDDGSVTVVALATRHPDGSATVRYYGDPISPARAALIERMAGPLVAEHMLSADDMAGEIDGVLLRFGHA